MSKESALQQVGAVPRSVTREAIEKAIHSFLGSYPAKNLDDVARRAALFANDVIFEDPVGATPILTKTDLIEFFKGPMNDDIDIRMRSEKIIVNGNEAISFTKASWGKPGTKPAYVDIVHNFVLNSEGKITRVRIFFDEGCIS